jgi:hypothetical protein
MQWSRARVILSIIVSYYSDSLHGYPDGYESDSRDCVYDVPEESDDVAWKSSQSRE